MIFTLLFKNIFNTCTIYDKKGTFWMHTIDTLPCKRYFIYIVPFHYSHKGMRLALNWSTKKLLKGSPNVNTGFSKDKLFVCSLSFNVKPHKNAWLRRVKSS